MDIVSEIKDLVSMAVCGLCDNPKTVKITVTAPQAKNLFITIFCDKPDIRLVVGREGRNIHALRTIAGSISIKNQLRMTMVIDE